MYDICRRITRDTNGDGLLDQFGTYNYSWRNAVYTSGGKLFDEENGQMSFTEPHVLDALKYVKRLNDLNQGQRVTQEDFDKGNVAFMPLTFAEYRTYKTYPYKVKKYSKFQWDCITFSARQEGESISSVDALLIGINSKTKHEQLAWEFLKQLTCEEEMQMDIFRYSPGVSVLKDVARSQEVEGIIQKDMDEGEQVINSENLFNVKMGGGDVDCATWKLTSTPLFVNNDLLADLTPMIDTWADKNDIDDNIYSIMKETGGSDQIYVMPWNIQVLYVYYRPSVFAQAGIEVPETYEEFLTAIEKCTMDTNGDGKTDVYGFGMRGAKGGQEPWGSFVYGRGGSFEDMTTAESVQGMQDFIDIYTKGYVPPTATSDGFNEIIANFQSGLTAMTIHYTGSSANMVTALGDDVSAFPFPAGTGQWTSMGDTETIIFESCKNKEAAFEWVSYLAAGEGQKMWCEGTGNVPVSKTVQAGRFFQDNRFMKASIEGQSYAGILPILDTTTEWISTLWPNTVSQALTGSITAEQCMKTLQDGLYQ